MLIVIIIFYVLYTHANKIRIKRVDPLFVIYMLGWEPSASHVDFRWGPNHFSAAKAKKLMEDRVILTISVTRGARDTCNHHVTWVLVERPAVEIYGTRHLQGVFFIIIILFY